MGKYHNLIRYNKIDKCEICNGEGVGVSFYIQGCPIHCPGCFNPETWDFDGGEPITGYVESQLYKALKPDYIQRLSILGGEPLVWDNLYQLNYILCTVKSNWPQKKVWIYTGYTWEELQEASRKNNPNYLFVTFKYSDYLVCGPFIEAEKDLTLKWRGSRNQRIIDIQATKENCNKPIYIFE